MAPSNDDDLDHDDRDLDPEAAVGMDEDETDPDDLESDRAADSDEEDEEEEEDDGLAPESGRRRPSLLSLLLLVAGAIWILVALLKLGDASSEIPAVAIGDTDGVLGDRIDEYMGVEGPQYDGVDGSWEADEAGLEPFDPQPPLDPANSQETGPVVGDPELVGGEDGNPASERGPPEGSLLAGKVWPRDFSAPEIVTYTIKRGGSMKVVANLYKIFHHEIEALNPGVSLEGELPASTKIVVYRRKAATSSQSIGSPGSGSLEGAMPMVDGPGRILKHTPWKGWATTTTVATLDVILREWERRFPKRQPILVGNMSARDGGRLKPHSSHQSGRDVDLSYPQIWDRKEELNWRTMGASNLDRELTWALIELLRESGSVEVIIIDSKLQKLLFEYAVETQRYDKKTLENWMEYPRSPGAGDPLIQHVAGHEDHLHVRFKCTVSETRCKSSH